LYYLRDLRGKASKIRERRAADGSIIVEETPAPVAAKVEAQPVAVEEAVVEAPAAETAETSETTEA
jgi:hypothetical protein